MLLVLNVTGRNLKSLFMQQHGEHAELLIFVSDEGNRHRFKKNSLSWKSKRET